MARYWWVNHNQTHLQEINGGFLWSPKREANGNRSRFYDNMRLARVGDRVLSFAGSRIGFVGTVSGMALSAGKPTEFARSGSNWAEDGWLLPVAWQCLAKPVRPKDMLAKLRPLLPTKYSPIHSEKGAGNQKAYLAEIGANVFELITQEGESLSSEEHFLASSLNDGVSFRSKLDDIAERAILEDQSTSVTEREQIIKARRGQGVFRANVCKIEKQCRVTGVRNPAFLIASHIKPWRSCGSAFERLDGHNGLLLSPNVDLLFDSGLLTFMHDGSVLLSNAVEENNIKLLGLSCAVDTNVGPFSTQQQAYLEYHLTEVFTP